VGRLVAHKPLPEFGPYVATRVLATGGMSVVWHATHRATGEAVALKTVRVPDEVYLASLRREIHALSRLRHPGVVRIVAEGLTGGVPWYAMELLAGETLGDVHAKSWARPRTDPGEEHTTVRVAGAHRQEEPASGQTTRAIAAGGHLPRVLTLVRRLCTPLAFLHGEGIVHCDLKPHNVLISPGDLPVLVDFGLAWRAAGVVGREVAEVITKVAGTPAYMAPEQIRLDAIDPRTDLYALGCVLYELVVGHTPFVGGHDVLVQQLTRAPTPPSALVTGVPPALDRLILALLAKQPRERIGYAEDVIVALEKLGAEPDRESMPCPRPRLYRPTLSGRERVLRELLAAVERPKVGAGSCVLLGGESGIGKTFLATEVARRAGAELKVVASTCAPRGSLRAGSELLPFQELFGAIADRCTALGADATDRILGPRGKVLAPYAPRLARLPGVADHPDPPELSGAAAKELVFAALRETIAAFAREEPLLLLLDDLQWADELGLEFLATLPDGFIEEHPIAILATYRSEDRSDALARILARRDVRGVTIGRLDEGNVRDVVRDMLAMDRLPDAFVRFLARQSEGNPFFVAEYLRTAVAEGVVRRASDDRISVGGSEDDQGSGVFERLAVPRTIRELVGRRIHALSDSARALAEVACVIGRTFDAETLQSAAHATDALAMEGLAELLAREVIEPMEGGRFQFVHDKLREVACGSIPEDRRIGLHLAVARAIEESLLERSDPDAVAAVLAHHYCCAHDHDHAVVWLERAGRRALQHTAYREATEHFEQAIHLATRSDARDRARLLAAAARAAFGAGDATLTDHHAQRGLALLDAPLPETRAGWLTLLGRELATQVSHLAGVVFGRARTEHDRVGLRDAATTAGLLTHRYFYADDAVAMFTTSLLSVNLAERASAETAVSRPYTMIGFAAGLLGADRLAASYFTRARAGATDDPVERAFALTVEGVYHSGSGRWHAAERAIAAAEALLVGVHEPLIAELTLTAHGHLEFYSGLVVEAEHRFEELLRRARERSSQQHQTWAQFSIARSLVARDRAADALPLLHEAARSLAHRPELQSEIICHGLLASAHTAVGDLESARAAADATAARIRRARPTGFPALEGYRGAIRAYLALGDRANAARVLRALGSFARVFPIGRPSLELYRGELARTRIGAERHFRATLAAARERAMPREETEALRALDRSLNHR